MADQTGRFGWVSKLSQAAIVATLVLLVMALISFAAFMLADLHVAQQVASPAAWLLVIVGLVLLGLWAAVLTGTVRAVVTGTNEASDIASSLARIETLAETQVNLSRKLIDLATLSDDAKSLIYRERELEAFRETFHEMVLRQEYDGAQSLVDSIESKFGYAPEAAHLR